MGLRGAASHDAPVTDLNAILKKGDGAAQRRAIYNWHELGQRTEDVVDIYSAAWQERIETWRQWIATNADKIDLQAIVSQSRQVRAELDISVFFFLYPVPAFSLWHLLEACYAIDEAVFRRSTEPVSTWRQQKPFVYLESPDVRRKWKAQLEALNSKMASGELAGEERRVRVNDIVARVQRLDRVLTDLETNFNANLGADDRDWMLAIIRSAVHERFNLIADTFKPPSLVVETPAPLKRQSTLKRRRKGRGGNKKSQSNEEQQQLSEPPPSPGANDETVTFRMPSSFGILPATWDMHISTLKWIIFFFLGSLFVYGVLNIEFWMGA